MYRFILSLTMVVSLAAASGCGASAAARHSATPAGTNVADVSSDPSWCPPGEDFQVSEAKTTATPAPKREEATSIHPNAAKRPTTGAVHAAVY